MPLAIEEMHLDLARAVDDFIDRYAVADSAREQLAPSAEPVPVFWKALPSTGFLGIHVPEDFGGAGAGLNELAIVIERFGYAMAAGPLLATVTTSAIVADVADRRVQEEVLPGLATGELVGATGLHGALSFDGDTVSGSAELVLGAHLADVLVLNRGDHVLVVRSGTPGLTVTADPSLDPTRKVASVHLKSVRRSDVVEIPNARSRALAIQRALLAADAAAGAARCTGDSTEYAKQRKQFGVVIGAFQAVKHHCADMFIAHERATAAVWDALRARADGLEQFTLASAAAVVEATEAFVNNAKLNIQVHGGIGFTWEHDAHILLRRALTDRGLVFDTALADVVNAAQSDVRRTMVIELPEDETVSRTAIRGDAERLAALSSDEQRPELVRTGYLIPHWPPPWGRAASAVEQLVIDEEFRRARIRRPDLGIGAWILQTIIQHGNHDQIDRWVGPALHGTTTWCQLFSEPDAGSDAAAIRTKATKVDGGWTITGQKVWTSGAHLSDFGLATVRTDPAAPKHAGITTMVVDLSATGVTVRPLREATGESNFNEVFLDSVFVADEDVVGVVNAGWQVVRAALGNERVTIGSGSANPLSIDPVAQYFASEAPTVGRDEIGRFIVEDNVIRAMNHRRVLRAITGDANGPEGNVTKLLTARHVQTAAELAFRLNPVAAVSGRGDGGAIGHALIFSRAYSIGGGTTEISKNQIGERLLGLPRDSITGSS
jgi:3-oxochol-4-en-24-oyl-CoA dehydrogenase